MESTLEQIEDSEDVEILLDLDDGGIEILPNAPFVLSGLDTMNPILVIGDKKLIGTYEETIGTCLVFTEPDATPLVHEETGPSEENLFYFVCMICYYDDLGFHLDFLMKEFCELSFYMSLL